MRLLICLTITLLLLLSSSEAFVSPNSRVVVVVHKPTSSAAAAATGIRTPTVLFASPENTALVEAYAKKAAKKIPEVTTMKPPPAPVVEDKPSILDSIMDKVSTTTTPAPAPPVEVVPPPVVQEKVVKQVVETATTKAQQQPVVVTNKAPTLLEYLKTKNAAFEATTKQKDPSFFDVRPSESSSSGGASLDGIVANAKEKWAIIQENALHLKQSATTTSPSKIGLPEGLGLPKDKLAIIQENYRGMADVVSENTREITQVTKELSSSVVVPPAVKGATAAAFPNLNDLIENLHLDKYGAWYAGAAVAILLVASRGGDAGTAAPAKPPQKAASSKALKQMQVEQEMLKKEMEKLTKQNAQLQKELKAAQEKVPFFADNTTVAVVAKETLRPRDLEEAAAPPKKQPPVVKKEAAAPPKKQPPVVKKEAPVAAKAKKKVFKKKTLVKKKVAVKKKEEVVVVAAVAPKKSPVKSDWSELSESTLKRKTVKELTAYLTSRGVGVTDENGKTLTKAAMASAVKSL